MLLVSAILRFYGRYRGFSVNYMVDLEPMDINGGIQTAPKINVTENKWVTGLTKTLLLTGSGGPPWSNSDVSIFFSYFYSPVILALFHGNLRYPPQCQPPKK